MQRPHFTFHSFFLPLHKFIHCYPSEASLRQVASNCAVCISAKTGWKPKRHIAQSNALGTSWPSIWRAVSAKGKIRTMPHCLLLRLQRANKLITFYPGRLPWAIILLGIRPAIARNIGCCTITLNSSPFIVGNWHTAKTGWKPKRYIVQSNALGTSWPTI